MPRALLCFVAALFLCLPVTAQNAAGGIANYVRYQKSSPGKLETAIVNMVGPGGQSLDLVAAVHLGEASYYKDLNTRFKAYDAVLYELILPEEVAGQRLPAQMEASGGLSGVQGMMGRSLGLTTQIENIDYSGSNFVHADLTQEALTKTMSARQESLLTYMQKILLSSNAQSGEVDLGVTDQELAELDLMSILAGTTTAKDRRVLKKLMASVMSSPEGSMGALSDSVLLSERNKAALKVLDRELGKGKRKLALFYGAAHMPDIEERLVSKGWRRGKATWLQAWTI
jgi:hypothetical protein